MGSTNFWCTEQSHGEHRVRFAVPSVRVVTVVIVIAVVIVVIGSAAAAAATRTRHHSGVRGRRCGGGGCCSFYGSSGRNFGIRMRQFLHGDGNVQKHGLRSWPDRIQAVKHFRSTLSGTTKSNRCVRIAASQSSTSTESTTQRAQGLSQTTTTTTNILTMIGWFQGPGCHDTYNECPKNVARIDIPGSCFFNRWKRIISRRRRRWFGKVGGVIRVVERERGWLCGKRWRNG